MDALRKNRPKYIEAHRSHPGFTNRADKPCERKSAKKVHEAAMKECTNRARSGKDRDRHRFAQTMKAANVSRKTLHPARGATGLLCHPAALPDANRKKGRAFQGMSAAAKPLELQGKLPEWQCSALCRPPRVDPRGMRACRGLGGLGQGFTQRRFLHSILVVAENHLSVLKCATNPQPGASHGFFAMRHLPSLSIE